MPEVLMSRDGHVATITLNRPDRLNAISGPMLADLARMLVDCDGDREVRVVVLTGAGRGFCSGLDLQDVAAGQGIGSGGAAAPAGSASTTRRRSSSAGWTRPVLCASTGPPPATAWTWRSAAT